jgi:hypothetical protein
VALVPRTQSNLLGVFLQGLAEVCESEREELSDLVSGEPSLRPKALVWVGWVLG